MDKKEITSYARGYEKGREVGRREIIEKLKSKMWDKFNKKKDQTIIGLMIMI